MDLSPSIATTVHCAIARAIKNCPYDPDRDELYARTRKKITQDDYLARSRPAVLPELSPETFAAVLARMVDSQEVECLGRHYRAGRSLSTI